MAFQADSFQQDAFQIGGEIVIPGVAALTSSLLAPQIGFGYIPPVTALVTSLFAPASVLGTRVIPGIASLTTTGFAPSMEIDVVVVPGLLSLSSSLFAPNFIDTSYTLRFNDVVDSIRFKDVR